MKTFMKLIVVIALMSGAVFAQKKTDAPAGHVDFSPVRLSLGMPKDRTITMLSEYYGVDPWKGGSIEDSWAVSEKTGHHFVIGVISFVNGVLIRAARYWEVQESAYFLAHTVGQLLEHLRDEGFTSCTISTHKAPTPTIDTDVLVIDCGQKGVVVQADQYRGKDTQVVQVMENLEAQFTAR